MDQRRIRSQEAFLVGVEDRYQRYFRQVEPFSQQVDPDKHVEFTRAEFMDQFRAFERRYVRMQVSNFDLGALQKIRQVLGKFFGERRDQNTLFEFDARFDLFDQIINLPLERTHFDDRIE